MKRIIIKAQLVALSLIIASAAEAKINTDLMMNKQNKHSISIPFNFIYENQFTSDTIRLKPFNFQIDPLGILFYGPQVSVDYQFADMFTIGPFFRWNYAGILYRSSRTEWFFSDNITSTESYSYGISIKFVPSLGTGRHRPYFDLGVELFKGSEYTDEYSNGRYIFEYRANIYHLGAGYRMTTRNKFNLSAGIYSALYNETENMEYYENAKNESLTKNDLNVKLLIGLQLTLGWQIGK